MRRLSMTSLAVAVLALAVSAQENLPGDLQIVPRLTGTADPIRSSAAPPLPNWVVDDQRVGRNYPEQPPVIPHSIDGYQLTVNANRCLECHRRQFTELVGAPMISISHFVDRQGQMLADVAPRRYFCTACHVPQTDAAPLVENEFRDMLTLLPVEDE